MSLFKKEGDYIDYTLLQKKGILKIKDQSSVNDLIDFTQQSNPSTQISGSSQSTPLSQSQSPGSDFGSFFGSSEANPPAPSNIQSGYESPFASLDNPSPQSQSSNYNSTSNSDVSALRIKLDDFEFKIEKLLERLAKIESKLGSSI